ncbi:MAG: Holliday junction resolvase RuvX [Firmicutes bacterium]|nr:Holliday junction resolvase RuvX [Candidatus Fiminaster equi]
MKKYLGLDLGTTTVGIATNDSLGISVHPVETFRFEPGNFKAAREHVVELARKEGIKDIVLGMPLYQSGDVSPHAQSCIRFRDDLLKLDPTLVIEMVDESFSTIEADEKLKATTNLSYDKRKKIIDEHAAVVILERFLYSKGELK